MKKILSIIAFSVFATLSVAAQTLNDEIQIAENRVINAVDMQAVDTTFKNVVIVSDSIGKKAKKVKQYRDWSKWRPETKRAMWLAIVIPGAGQIYNRKFWKLPIVYGGLVGCIYAYRWNGMMYDSYSQAYLDIMDDDPNTKSYESFLHLGTAITPENIDRYKDIFRKRKDRFRRYRDMSLFCMIGVYGLSIIDAYVDASLSEFDITDDLSMKITPAYINNRGKNMLAGGSDPFATGGFGVRCKLNF